MEVEEQLMNHVGQLLSEIKNSGGGKSEHHRTRCRVTPGGLKTKVSSHGKCHRKNTALLQAG